MKYCKSLDEYLVSSDTGKYEYIFKFEDLENLESIKDEEKEYLTKFKELYGKEVINSIKNRYIYLGLKINFEGYYHILKREFSSNDNEIVYYSKNDLICYV